MDRLPRSYVFHGHCLSQKFFLATAQKKVTALCYIAKTLPISKGEQSFARLQTLYNHYDRKRIWSQWFPIDTSYQFASCLEHSHTDKG